MFHSPLVESLIDLAIREDLYNGDITTELTVNPSRKGRGVIVCREKAVVCGLPIVERIFDRFGVKADIVLKSREGETVAKETALLTIDGRLADILKLERISLNFLQRLISIATHVSGLCGRSKGITLLDTRKTTPGWRILEKYAVKVGGAQNHRFSLGDMVLVKDNHIDANSGSVTKTLRNVEAEKSPYMPLEVEVKSLNELLEALKFSPNIVMLDNMKDSDIKKALRIVTENYSSTLVEVSGGIEEKRFSSLKKMGVKYVSMGGLTFPSKRIDISLDIL